MHDFRSLYFELVDEDGNSLETKPKGKIFRKKSRKEISRLSTERKISVLNLRNKGWKIQKIANEEGVSHQRVSQILNSS